MGICWTEVFDITTSKSLSYLTVIDETTSIEVLCVTTVVDVPSVTLYDTDLVIVV